MPVELKVPEVGESIKEVQIGKWFKGPGERVAKDDNVVEIESDKATVDLPAPAAGTIGQVLKQAGETAAVGEVIGYLLAADEAAVAHAASGNNAAPASPAPPAAAAKQPPSSTPANEPPPVPAAGQPQRLETPPFVMPAAARLLAEQGLAAEAVHATGPGGRLLKEDVERHLERAAVEVAGAQAPSPAVPPPLPPAPADAGASRPAAAGRKGRLPARARRRRAAAIAKRNSS